MRNPSWKEKWEKRERDCYWKVTMQNQKETKHLTSSREFNGFTFRVIKYGIDAAHRVNIPHPTAVRSFPFAPVSALAALGAPVIFC